MIILIIFKKNEKSKSVHVGSDMVATIPNYDHL